MVNIAELADILNPVIFVLASYFICHQVPFVYPQISTFARGIPNVAVSPDIG